MGESASSALAFRAPSSFFQGIRKRSGAVSASLDPLQAMGSSDIPTVILVRPTPVSELPPRSIYSENSDLLRPIDALHPAPFSLPLETSGNRDLSCTPSTQSFSLQRPVNPLPAEPYKTSHYHNHLKPISQSLFPISRDNPTHPVGTHVRFPSYPSVAVAPPSCEPMEEESLPLLHGDNPAVDPRTHQPPTSPRLHAVIISDITQLARGILTPRMIGSIGRTTAHFTTKFPKFTNNRAHPAALTGIHHGLLESSCDQIGGGAETGYGLEGDTLRFGTWTRSKWVLVISVIMVWSLLRESAAPDVY